MKNTYLLSMMILAGTYLCEAQSPTTPEQGTKTYAHLIKRGEGKEKIAIKAQYKEMPDDYFAYYDREEKLIVINEKAMYNSFFNGVNFEYYEADKMLKDIVLGQNDQSKKCLNDAWNNEETFLITKWPDRIAELTTKPQEEIENDLYMWSQTDAHICDYHKAQNAYTKNKQQQPN